MDNLKQKAWDHMLQHYCHCYADAVGNRPCDNGAVCDRCMTKDAQDAYEYTLAAMQFKEVNK